MKREVKGKAYCWAGEVKNEKAPMLSIGRGDLQRLLNGSLTVEFFVCFSFQTFLSECCKPVLGRGHPQMVITGFFSQLPALSAGPRYLLPIAYNTR